MIRVVICAASVLFLVGCGRLGGEDAAEEAGGVVDSPSAVGEGGVLIWFGESTIEERILEAGTIVRARLSSNRNLEVVQGEGRWEEWYYILQTFELAVSEYLVGSGPVTVGAVLQVTGEYDSEEEARAAVAVGVVGTRRNTEWDDREAIFFLKDAERWRFPEYFEEAPEGSHFFGYEGYVERPKMDRYSFESPGNRLWLPADTRSSASGDGQVFLMAPVGDDLHWRGDQTMPDTITLGELKGKIAAALRRREVPEPQGPYMVGDLTIDYAERRVALTGRLVHLLPMEYRLLTELSASAGRVLTYEYLLDRVGGRGAAATCGPCAPSCASCVASWATTQQTPLTSSPSPASATACRRARR